MPFGGAVGSSPQTPETHERAIRPPYTFSAAGNLVAALGAETSAVFAGVSPGGSGSQFGDAIRIDLPYSGIAAFVPTRHSVFGDPGSQHVLHPMDVVIEPLGSDFFGGLDPVLEHYAGR